MNHSLPARRELQQLPRLESARIRLRALCFSDKPAVLALFGDPEIVKFMDIPLIRDLDEAERFLREIEESFNARELFQWGVEHLATGVIIGTVTLADIDWKNHRAEIGFAIARSHQRRGLMKEAVELLLDYGFHVLELHRVEAYVDERNIRSAQLMEALDFAREGLARDRDLLDGEYRSSWLYALIANDPSFEE